MASHLSGPTAWAAQIEQSGQVAGISDRVLAGAQISRHLNGSRARRNRERGIGDSVTRIRNDSALEKNVRRKHHVGRTYRPVAVSSPDQGWRRADGACGRSISCGACGTGQQNGVPRGLRPQPADVRA